MSWWWTPLDRTGRAPRTCAAHLVAYHRWGVERDRDPGAVDPAGGGPGVRHRVPRLDDRQRRPADHRRGTCPPTRSATLEGQAYVTSGYLAMLSAFLIIAGALADRYGRRRIFIIGLVVVRDLTSALCGLAPTMEWLVIFRLLQGAAGALLVPGPLSLITANFEGAGACPRVRHLVRRHRGADHPGAARRGPHRRLVLVAARLPGQRAARAARPVRRHPLRARSRATRTRPAASTGWARWSSRSRSAASASGSSAARSSAGPIRPRSSRSAIGIAGRDRVPRPDAPRGATRSCRRRSSASGPFAVINLVDVPHLRRAVHLHVPVRSSSSRASWATARSRRRPSACRWASC